MPGKPVIISACLLGEACRYDGASSHNSKLMADLEGHTLIPVCPEVSGGLAIPRPPAEIKDDQVIRQDGTRVTAEFRTGAEVCTQMAKQASAEVAILKSRSPACGCGQIYDGSFTKTLIKGDGIFTQALKSAGITCISDEDYLKDSDEPAVM